MTRKTPTQVKFIITFLSTNTNLSLREISKKVNYSIFVVSKYKVSYLGPIFV